MFERWVASVPLDLSAFIFRGRLHREKVAEACGFARSVLRQNKQVKTAFGAFEGALIKSGVLRLHEPVTRLESVERTDSDTESEDWRRRMLAAKVRVDKRLKDLEERNAVLSVEVQQLRQQLRRYQSIGKHLERTGRLLPI